MDTCRSVNVCLCSYDGIPFLMHDSTLKRTTNVAEVFPNRTRLDASMFSWAELQQLNAGDWFLSVRRSPSTKHVKTLSLLTVTSNQVQSSQMQIHSHLQTSSRRVLWPQRLKNSPVLQSDPFGTASSLSEQDRSRVHNQSIPSLAQFLEMASESGSLVLFDLHKPPHGHPYRQSYINVTLQVVHAHISSSQVSVQNNNKIDTYMGGGQRVWFLL